MSSERIDHDYVDLVHKFLDSGDDARNAHRKATFTLHGQILTENISNRVTVVSLDPPSQRHIYMRDFDMVVSEHKKRVHRGNPSYKDI